MMEFYYNFSDRFCDVDKLEEMEINTDPLYEPQLAKNCSFFGLAKNQDDSIRAVATKHVFQRTSRIQF